MTEPAATTDIREQRTAGRSIFARLFRHVALDVTPLRASRDYRLLYLGQFVSTFGSAISYVVLPWQMYQLTKSTFYGGLLGVVEFVPMFVLAFFGGALADSIDRRRLIMWAEVGLVSCCAALIVNSLLPEPRVWVLFVGAGIFSALNALHRPAHEALTPRLVPPAQLPAVSALTTFRHSFNFIVGPALAGIIAATFGAACAYGVDLSTYAVSLVTLMLIRTKPDTTDPAEKTQGEKVPARLFAVREGWLYARSRPELMGTYLIDLIAMFFAMPVVLFPKIAESHGNAAVGLFYSTMAIGPLAVSLTSGWTARVHRHGRAITLAVVVWGFAIVGFGLSKNLWLALVFLGIAGGADCVSGLFRMTMWNQTIPDRLRGRMASIEMISYLTGPYLGNAQAGMIASAFGLGVSLVGGGALCVLGAGLLALKLPAFIRYDGRDGLARKQIDEKALDLGRE